RLGPASSLVKEPAARNHRAAPPRIVPGKTPQSSWCAQDEVSRPTIRLHTAKACQPRVKRSETRGEWKIVLFLHSAPKGRRDHGHGGHTIMPVQSGTPRDFVSTRDYHPPRLKS